MHMSKTHQSELVMEDCSIRSGGARRRGAGDNRTRGARLVANDEGVRARGDGDAIERREQAVGHADGVGRARGRVLLY